eukprot:519920-Amphidinium_carterae.2
MVQVLVHRWGHNGDGKLEARKRYSARIGRPTVLRQKHPANIPPDLYWTQRFRGKNRCCADSHESQATIC